MAWLCHAVVLLAILSAASLTHAAPATSEQGSPTARKAAAKPQSTRRPAAANRRLAQRRAAQRRAALRRTTCATTVDSRTMRRLSKAQRKQVQTRGAYYVKGRKGRKARRGLRALKPRKARWICVRTAKQQGTTRRLAKPLGKPSKQRTTQVVTFPKTLDKPLKVDLPGSDRAGWRMLDAPKAPVQMFAAGAMYSTGAYDVVQQVGHGQLKESIAVHTRQGVRTWKWKLQYTGDNAPKLGRNGDVRYGAGMVIARPFVMRPGGRKIRNLNWKLDGDVLSLRINDARLPLPYVIDPASSYPQILYPRHTLVNGSTNMQELSPTQGGTANNASRVCAWRTGEFIVSSNNSMGTFTDMCDDPGLDAPKTNANNPSPSTYNGGSRGVHGWAQDSLGGATLAPGPYAVSVRTRYVQTGAANPTTVALKARLWKVRLNTAANPTVMTSWAPVTDWSSAGPAQAFNNNQVHNLTTSLTPTDRFLAPQDHVYVEFAYVITDAGRNATSSLLYFEMDHADTFINFGAAATNTPGTAANLRLASGPVNPAGWTTDSTPTLRANLDDPDWQHHIEYQICTTADCSVVVRTGTSPANQTIGSTNDNWTVPAGTPLPDGAYFMRARTVEDAGDPGGESAWTTYTGTTCTAVNIGACGAFGVDTVAPTGTITNPAGWYRGTVAVTGTASDATSGVASFALQWRRISPGPAGPLSTGISACGGTTAWSCTWNTTLVNDGDYELRLVVTDNAGHVSSTITKSTFRVDNTLPGAPGASNDGTTPTDIDWATSATTLQSFWTAASDPLGTASAPASGIAYYEYCLSTATNCGGTVEKSWTNNGLAPLDQTSTGLSLTEGATYYSCVRAVDVAGNTSPMRCSDGQTVDTLLPVAPTTVNDGTAADITWLQNLTTASANWSGGGDANLNRWEYCISTAVDCAGTVAKTWTSSGVTPNQTSAGLSLVQGEQYFVCVRGFDNAGNQSATNSCSNGQRVDTIAPPLSAGVNDGAAADIDVTNNTTTINANWTAVADPAPGVGVESGLQRYQYCISTNPTGTDCAAGATVAWTNNAPLTTPSLTRGGLALVNGSTYRVCIRSYDVASNTTGTHVCSDGVTIDTGPPATTWSAWSDPSNSPYLHPAAPAGSPNADLLWYNPNAVFEPTAVARATVTASDGIGMSRVEFPNLGAGADWGPGGTDTTVAVGNLWSWDYTFAAAPPIADPADANATAFDTAGNSATAGFRIQPDGVQPVVGVMPALSGLQSTTTVPQSIPLGMDAESGLARYVVDSQFAPMRDGVCQPWDPWVLGDAIAGRFGVASNGMTLNLTNRLNDPDADGVPNFSDSFCYRTQVRVYDNVGNMSTIAPNGHVRVDHGNPDVAFVGPADGSAQSGTFDITGTADDLWTGSGLEYPNTGSGLDRVVVTYLLPDGPDAGSAPDAAGTACTVTTFTGTWDSHGWTCSWDTSLLPDGLYTVSIQSFDRVPAPTTRSSTIRTRTFLLDNLPPVLTWMGWNDNASPYMHSLARVAWVNPTAPAGAYQLDARVTATDAGSGVASISFPAMGAGWSPAGAAGPTYPPVRPASVDYTQSFTFANPAAIAAPGTRLVTARDGANSPSTTDYEVRLDGTAPTGMDASVINGLQNNGLISVTLTPGVEGALESGLGSWRLEYETAAALENNICGPWTGVWTTATSGLGSPPAAYTHDVTALGSNCYRYRVIATDNVGNNGISTPNTVRRVDLTPPTVAITSPVTGSNQGGTFNVAGTAADNHSGVQRVRVTWAGPSGSGVICDTTTLGGASPTWTYSCPWNTITPAMADGWYTITATSYDVSTHASTPQSITVLLDNLPPVLNWMGWNDYASPFMHTLARVAWVNPNAPVGTYQLDARVTATDNGSGVASISFPAMGAGWTPAGASGASFPPVHPANVDHTRAFTFTNPASLAAPGSLLVTARDGANNPSTTNYEVRLDGTAPTGVAATVVNGLQNTGLVAVTLTPGSEGALESGLGSWMLEYETAAALENNVCGPWTGVWNTAASGVGSAPATYTHDVTALGSNCYRYRLTSTDNVGNAGASTPNTVRRVDLTPPTVAITAPANGSDQGGTFNVTGTAADNHSGVQRVRVTWSGPETPGSGVICDTTTLGGASPLWTFSCPWNTTTFDDGWYTVTATSYDVALHASVTQSVTVRLDNMPPVLSLFSWNDNGSAAMHTSGPIAWINPTAPAGAYQLDANLRAQDAGSGVASVSFPAMGAGWSPAIASDATRVSGSINDGMYQQAFTFADPSTIAAPGVRSATARDGANNPSTIGYEVRLDSAGPVGGSIGYANGYVASVSVPVTFNTGVDAAGESGFREWRLMRSNGTLSGGNCIGWSGYTTLVSSGAASTTTGSFTDTVTDPGCFRYQLLAFDNVDNVRTITGANEVKVDLTPPSGTFTLAEGTNPDWQYLANPTRLYVNTSAGHAGNFTASVNGATAASGILDVDFPLLAAGFTGETVMPGPGPNFVNTYSWTAPASNPGPRVARVRSNSLGALNLPFDVIADPTAPAGASASHTSGYTTASSVTVTYTGGSDTGSGMAEYQLEREAGTLAAGACTWSGTWTNAGPVNGPLSITDATLAHGNCYRFRVRMEDRVENTGYSVVTAPIMIDQTAPTATMEFVEFGAGIGTAIGATSDVIYYQPTRGTPAAREQFSMRVRIVDPESGPGTVTFPTFAGNWNTPGAPTINADGATRRYDRWNLAAEPGAVIANVTNGAGMTAVANGSVLADTSLSSAASWSITYTHGYDIDLSFNVSWTDLQTDDRSGFGSYELVRRAWPYDGGMCDHTVAPVDVSLGSPAGNAHVDTSGAQPFCYRYFLRVTDRVENEVLVWASTGGNVPALFATTFPTWNYRTIASVDDIFPPAPFTFNLPTNPALPAITTLGTAPSCATVPTYPTATPTFDWTASSDGESGLMEYRVFIDGTATVDATVGAPATSWTTPAMANGAHTIGVRALDNQYNTTDSGPAFPNAIRIDGTAPNAGVTSPAGGTWTVDTTPTLTWAASDANCLARVEVYVDDMVTPVAVAAGGETSWTPAAALTDGMHSWRIEAIDSVGKRTSSVISNFGIDTTPPVAFSLTTPTAGQTVRGFVDVAWNASNDLESGLSPAAAYDVYVDGSLEATIAAGTTTARITGIGVGAHTVFVRARDLVGNTRDTATVSFTGFNTMPAPMLDLPLNNARVNTVPLLDWHWNNDGGPAPTDYDVLVDGVLQGNVTHPTSQLAIADPGDGVHTWRVVQHDPYTGTVNSVIRTFNLDRTAPINLGPLSRAGTIVSWPTPTDPDAPTASGMQNQEFWIDDGVNPPTSTTLLATASSRNFGSLPDGTYTMWVRAFDRAGNSTDSPPISVVTDSVPPTAFTLDPPPALPAVPAITNAGTAPACSTAPTYGSATPTLSWAASSDSTSGLAGYDVVVDGATIASVGAGVTSLIVPAPLAPGAHTWQVIARDNFGLTRASTPAPMNVRVDTANPSINFGSPADNAYTADSTPTLGWNASDDNCVARVEITLDGVVREVVPGDTGSWTPSAALGEGPHTWSLRAFDSAGNVAATAGTRTINVDSTGPTGVTAVFPTNAGSAPEQMMTFQWSAGTDGGGSGIDHYDLTVDGTVVASNLTSTTRGTFAIYAGAHTWGVRAYDAVGNSTMFNFAFTATPVPDVTPPTAFNLLTPANNANFTAGDSLTWQPAWDFHGVTQYRIYIDGALAGTTAGNVSSYTPLVGAGTPICTIDYDPAPGAGCVSAPTYANGEVSGGDSTPAAAASSDWNLAGHSGWNSGGDALGFGDPSITPGTAAGAGFDGDRMWTAADYTAAIPSGGADLRFEHRYLAHKVGNNGYDGMTIELKVDDAGNGFGDDPWEGTCTYGARAVYGSTVDCQHEIVEVDGGYNVAFRGPATAHPLAYRNGFSGDSGGVVQTKLRMSDFAGMNVMLRFKVGTDGCYSGMVSQKANYCTSQGAAGWRRAMWRIDNLALTAPDLLPGPHTWYVEARDAAGNIRQSNQTWTINIL